MALKMLDVIFRGSFDHCALCNGPLETCIHLALHFPFAKSVWRLTLGWGYFDENLVILSEEPTKLTQWWEVSQAKIPKSERRRFNEVECKLPLEQRRTLDNKEGHGLGKYRVVESL
jgi:hypothetical protein